MEESGGSKGDILVFLTGREEIETVQDTLLRCCQLFPSDWLDLLVCPLFAALPSSQQNRVFQATPPGSRKVILSTNIAETSITIPGVRYVVDTGVAKVRGFNPRVRLDMLMVQPISKAQVRGRGRGSGKGQREWEGAEGVGRGRGSGKGRREWEGAEGVGRGGGSGKGQREWEGGRGVGSRKGRRS